MNRKRKLIQTKEKGSFLIELLVAFFIISIAMTVVVDTFVTSQRSYYVASEKADLTSSLAFLLEDMTREARVSTSFTCALPPCSGASDFKMTHIVGLNSAGPNENVQYVLVNGATKKIQKMTPDGLLHDMTPPGVAIDDFMVTVHGQSPKDPIRAQVSLTAHSVERPEQIINIQTSYTSRNY